MKEFKTSGGFESASIGTAAPANSRENRDNNNRVDEGLIHIHFYFFSICFKIVIKI